MTDKVTNIATEWIGEFVQNIVAPYALPIVERNLLPDAVIRVGVRREVYLVSIIPYISILWSNLKYSDVGLSQDQENAFGRANR